MKKSGESVAERWARIQREIEKALQRRPDSWSHQVQVVAVSKGQSPDVIREAADVGLLAFAENYVQEAVGKQEALVDQKLEWHFIGHLQSNKVKKIIGRFQWIHSLDRMSLVEELEKGAMKTSPVLQKVLIEVRLGGEASKSGCTVEDLSALASRVQKSPHLQLEGLMTMPPFQEDGEKSRPYFRQLATLRRELEQHLGVKLPHLSMGTSQDYGVAIEEGATFIRLGRQLLGDRTRS